MIKDRIQIFIAKKCIDVIDWLLKDNLELKRSLQGADLLALRTRLVSILKSLGGFIA